MNVLRPDQANPEVNGLNCAESTLWFDFSIINELTLVFNGLSFNFHPNFTFIKSPVTRFSDEQPFVKLHAAMHGILYLLLGLMAIFALAASTTPSCSTSKSCPKEHPCCSEGTCSTGTYCLGGCDPLTWYSLNALLPRPWAKIEPSPGQISTTQL